MFWCVFFSFSFLFLSSSLLCPRSGEWGGPERQRIKGEEGEKGGKDGPQRANEERSERRVSVGEEEFE